ncbi:MAG: hypothetical protein HC896_05365, partial [Bacteroidales bacterium]|nr:hypothetical protein [Bacteroidales bacterium]
DKTNDDLLDQRKPFRFWEAKELKHSNTYYVDQNNPVASDNNQGTEEMPFKTISKAAETLMPGERVLIKEGVYREKVQPMRGGTSADKMIVYEAYQNNKVQVKGSIVLPASRFTPGKGWLYSDEEKYTDTQNKSPVTVWQFTFKGEELMGYNPFAMMNILHDRSWLDYKQAKMEAHFKRRGTIFIDGQAIQQVLDPVMLAGSDSGACWIEHNGLTLHVRFPNNSGPEDH